jgi:hypothetical protein
MKMLADNALMPTLASIAPKHTMTSEILNRRNAERFKLGTALVAVVVGAHGRTAETKGFFEGHAYDVSQDGIRIELDSTLPVGTPVEVEMHMPGMGAIRLIGEVAREFDEIDDPGPRRMGIHVVRGATAADMTRFERLLDQGSLGRLV